MLKKFLPTIIFSFLVILALILSIIPDIYRLSITPPDTTFPLLHNHPEDYYSYLSYMYTGFEGKWLVTARVTSEHFEPKFVYTFYIMLGHLARITHISLPWMYFIARIIAGTLVLMAALSVIRKLFSQFKYQLLACIFVFFGTGFWTIETQNGNLSIQQFLTFWTHFDPIMRTTFLPHHTISIFLGMLSLVFLAKSFENLSLKNAFWAGVLGLLSGLNYHGTLTNILGAVVLTLVSLFLVTLLVLSNNKWIIKSSYRIKALAFGIYIFISSLSLLYLLYLTTTVWPWTWNQNSGDNFSFFVSFKEYVAVLGPTLPLTILGLPLIFASRKILALLLLAWAVFPFLGLFILINVFPRFSNMTYLEGTSYIPLGILAVYGVKMLEKKLTKPKIVPILLFLLFVYFIPPHISSIYAQAVKFSPYYYNRFIPNDLIRGFDWLRLFSTPGSTVLSGNYMGALIPAYSHNYVVYGDQITTYNASEKAKDVVAFFSQKDIKGAEKIISKYAVSYVFFGPDTTPPDEMFTSRLGLEKVFYNSRVTIYKVKK